MSSLKVTGFVAAGEGMIDDLMAGMDAFALMVMEDSLKECPIDTGTLRRSAAMEPAHMEGDDVVCEIGYGYGDEVNPETRRPASDYAVPVHEIIEAFHNPPTKAKFLEDPVYANSFQMEAVLALYLGAGHGHPATTNIIAAGGGNEFMSIASMFPSVVPIGDDDFVGEHIEGRSWDE